MKEAKRLHNVALFYDSMKAAVRRERSCGKGQSYFEILQQETVLDSSVLGCYAL